MRLLLPVIFFASSLAGAQTTTPVPAGKSKIHLEGSVVSVSGEALQNASLTLQNRDVPRNDYMESSGNDGKFVFEGVLPGRYILFAQKSGYLTQRYGVRSNSAPDFILGISDGQTIKGLDIKMTPQSVVTGRVTDADGAPIVDVTVEAMRYDFVSGKKQLVSAGSAVTNDQGDFRISSLAAERYYLKATPKRRLAVQPASQEVNIATFYPNGLDAWSAVSLNIAAGSELRGLDIRMKRGRIYSLQGRVVDASTGKSASDVPVAIGTSDPISFAQSLQVRPDGGFEFRNLLPGSYFLYSAPRVAGPNAAASCLTGRLDDVAITDSSIDNITMLLRPCLQISGNIKLDDDSKSRTQQYQPGAGSLGLTRGMIALTPADGLPQGYRAQLKDDGTFVVSQVGLTKFFVNVIGLSENQYVRSVRFGAQDVTRQPLDLSSGSAGTLDILLSSKAAEVSGTVRNKRGESMTGFRVTLWPKTPNPGSVAGGVKQTTTDQEGGFRITGLAPGDYFVAAWEELESGLAASAEFLARFTALASPIKLAEGGRESLSIDLVPRTKTAAEIASIP